MGWQKRSSGRRYHSYIGHAFIIGRRSKTIIGMVLYYNVFSKFDVVEKERSKSRIK